MVPPVAVRLRRDFKTVLTLIRAHALLHQASRQKDADGCLKAEIADYAAVRELVADLVAEGADATIKPEVRETVKAVTDLLAGGKAEVMQADIKKALKLDKSAVSRRVTVAVDAGVLRNLEDRKGRPARLVLGDPLPDEIELLPEPERLHGCAVAEGVACPPGFGEWLPLRVLRQGRTRRRSFAYRQHRRRAVFHPSHVSRSRVAVQGSGGLK